MESIFVMPAVSPFPFIFDFDSLRFFDEMPYVWRL